LPTLPAKINMRLIFILLFGIVSLSTAVAQQPRVMAATRLLLPNGWSLSPAGKSLPLGDLPLNIVFSSSKKLLAVTNNGQSTQSIQLIDVKTEKILDNIIIPTSWLGLTFADHDHALWVSAGNENQVLKYGIVNNKLILKDSIRLGAPWPEKISPAGIQADDARHLLYVVTKDNNRLYVIDLLSKKILHKVSLPGEAYTCLLSPAKDKLYISCWGCSKVLVYNTALNKISAEIPSGVHPNDLCQTKNGEYLFVANAEDNSVSVIKIQQNKVIETLNAALYPDAVTGSTTNAVALGNDDKELYIANADNNCLAVFDVSIPGKSTGKGFIPVGWYPTSIRVNEKKIFVSNGKGFTSRPNPLAPDPINEQGKRYHRGDTSQYESQYIGGLFKGSLSIIDRPTEKQLGIYSKMVYDNTPYHKNQELFTAGEPGNPVPQHIGDSSPVKHVFYIIKENRTYDQVLGDIKEGNGDTSLVLFGENITPNLHAIAKQFVLLDNFYVDGEVSADGHNWSMGGYANDYLEKNWVTSYGGRGGTYDGEGTRAIANNKKGFIWDHCKRAGVSYRTYGEFVDDYKPNLPVLKDHYCTYYTSWDQHVRDTTRVTQWKRDFDSLVAIDRLPQLNTLRIINDHTEGLNKGRPTPFAQCADNDLAVGMFIDYLSRSSVWKESVVFVLEDDAQDGPDHVDAHRSTAYLAGGFVKRNFVDHTMYSTSSVLRTIELILGIPPMSQYDAAANSLWRCFNKTADTSGFVALPARVDLNEKNTGENAWQKISEQFDFSKEDRAPDRAFTEVIWKAVKGLDAVAPAARRAAFVRESGDDPD
jgi:YVTN family beta-propeller protein